MDVGSTSSGMSQISRSTAQMAAIMQYAVQATTEQAMKQIEVGVQMQLMQSKDDTLGTVVDMFA